VIHIVTIQDKSLHGEPDVAIAVVDAADIVTAPHAADDTILELAEKGRGRCVSHAREVDLGRFYRLGAVVRLPPPDRDVAATSGDRAALWDAIHAYVLACGGDPSARVHGNVARMDAVVRVESAARYHVPVMIDASIREIKRAWDATHAPEAIVEPVEDLLKACGLLT
jgi:hypothetical protein